MFDIYLDFLNDTKLTPIRAQDHPLLPTRIHGLYIHPVLAILLHARTATSLALGRGPAPLASSHRRADLQCNLWINSPSYQQHFLTSNRIRLLRRLERPPLTYAEP